MRFTDGALVVLMRFTDGAPTVPIWFTDGALAVPIRFSDDGPGQTEAKHSSLDLEICITQ